jgi:hypothetical protein
VKNEFKIDPKFYSIVFSIPRNLVSSGIHKKLGFPPLAIKKIFTYMLLLAIDIDS